MVRMDKGKRSMNQPDRSNKKYFKRGASSSSTRMRRVTRRE
jgi:hypothetical protein